MSSCTSLAARGTSRVRRSSRQQRRLSRLRRLDLVAVVPVSVVAIGAGPIRAIFRGTEELFPLADAGGLPQLLPQSLMVLHQRGGILLDLLVLGALRAQLGDRDFDLVVDQQALRQCAIHGLHVRLPLVGLRAAGCIGFLGRGGQKRSSHDGHH